MQVESQLLAQGIVKLAKKSKIPSMYRLFQMRKL